jgi:hypothetical protein
MCEPDPFLDLNPQDLINIIFADRHQGVVDDAPAEVAESAAAG